MAMEKAFFIEINAHVGTEYLGISKIFGVVKQASTKTAVKWFFGSCFYSTAFKHSKGKETDLKFTPQGWQNFNKSPDGKTCRNQVQKGLPSLKIIPAIPLMQKFLYREVNFRFIKRP